MTENLFTTKMSGDKKSLQNRLKNILYTKGKFSKLKAFVALCITLAVFASGVTIMASINKANDIDILADSEFASVLIVGTDNSGRADAIMLISAKDNKLTALSIPRNTLIGSERADDYLSVFKNITFMPDTISRLWDISTPNLVQLDLATLEKAIDAIGGITVDIPMDMQYTDPHQGLDISLKQGKQTLNGKEVCNALRFRRSNDGTGYEDGDISRIKMGQQIAAELLSNTDISDAVKLFKELSGNIYTNYSESTFADAAKVFAKAETAEFHILPGKLGLLKNNLPAYFPDTEAAAEILEHFRDYNSAEDIIRRNVIQPVAGSLSQGFGTRVHPITGDETTHNGLDIVAVAGTPILAATGGTVTEVGDDDERGNYIVITSPESITTTYCHMQSSAIKLSGKSVSQGDVIGYVGNTGKSTGPHLHFEVAVYGKNFDPMIIY